jgi:hypothetical protein
MVEMTGAGFIVLRGGGSEQKKDAGEKEQKRGQDENGAADTAAACREVLDGVVHASLLAFGNLRQGRSESCPVTKRIAGLPSVHLAERNRPQGVHGLTVAAEAMSVE